MDSPYKDVSTKAMGQCVYWILKMPTDKACGYVGSTLANSEAEAERKTAVWWEPKYMTDFPKDALIVRITICEVKDE